MPCNKWVVSLRDQKLQPITQGGDRLGDLIAGSLNSIRISDRGSWRVLHDNSGTQLLLVQAVFVAEVCCTLYQAHVAWEPKRWGPQEATQLLPIPKLYIRKQTFRYVGMRPEKTSLTPARIDLQVWEKAMWQDQLNTNKELGYFQTVNSTNFQGSHKSYSPYSLQHVEFTEYKHPKAPDEFNRQHHTVSVLAIMNAALRSQNTPNPKNQYMIWSQEKDLRTIKHVDVALEAAAAAAILQHFDRTWEGLAVCPDIGFGSPLLTFSLRQHSPWA